MGIELKGTTNKEIWLFNYKNASKATFSFSYAGEEIFESDGIELGVMKESSGLTRALRPHFSVKTNECSVDSETVLPFGSEPRIRRKCEQSANYFRVTTDISIPYKTSADYISVDSLKIKGQWKEIDLYIQKISSDTKITRETILTDNLSLNKVKFENIPIAIVFRNEIGVEIEFGVGYDLWRWNRAAKFRAENSFSIKKEKEHIIFERKVFVWEIDYNISKFNFRYTWYFAWIKNSEKNKKNSTKKRAEVLRIKNNKLTPTSANCSSVANLILSNMWPETVCSTNSSNACFAARQTEKLLKDFIRSTLRNNVKEREKNIFLREIEPHICFKSSHLKRSKEESLAHWNYFYIMAFYEWANRFLYSIDKKFHISLQKDSILSNLPSAQGLENF